MTAAQVRRLEHAMNPKLGAPGSIIEIDGMRFEVWCAAPTLGCYRAVWATLAGSPYYWHVNFVGGYRKCAPDGAVKS